MSRALLLLGAEDCKYPRVLPLLHVLTLPSPWGSLSAVAATTEEAAAPVSVIFTTWEVLGDCILVIYCCLTNHFSNLAEQEN